MQDWDRQLIRLQDSQTRHLANQRLSSQQRKETYRGILYHQNFLKQTMRQVETLKQKARLQSDNRINQHNASMLDHKDQQRKLMRVQADNYNKMIAQQQFQRRMSLNKPNPQPNPQSFRINPNSPRQPLYKIVQRKEICLPFPKIKDQGGSPLFIGNRIYQDSLKRRSFLQHSMEQHARNLKVHLDKLS